VWTSSLVWLNGAVINKGKGLSLSCSVVASFGRLCPACLNSFIWTSLVWQGFLALLRAAAAEIKSRKRGCFDEKKMEETSEWLPMSFSIWLIYLFRASPPGTPQMLESAAQLWRNCASRQNRESFEKGHASGNSITRLCSGYLIVFICSPQLIGLSWVHFTVSLSDSTPMTVM
jgi:hypothetical protein